MPGTVTGDQAARQAQRGRVASDGTEPSAAAGRPSTRARRAGPLTARGCLSLLHSKPDHHPQVGMHRRRRATYCNRACETAHLVKCVSLGLGVVRKLTCHSTRIVLNHVTQPKG